jgi:iron complex outermembrane receptor protein
MIKSINFGRILIRQLAILFCLAPVLSLNGQDSLLLPTITINDHYFPFTTTLLNDRDSSLMHAKYFMDIGSFLDKRTPVYIRKYGPGLSYSLSVRGSNSAQVNILWNDIPVNSPMQGQSDLSLFNFTEDALIKFDPNTYAYGLSGALSIDGISRNQKGSFYSLTETLTSTRGHRTSMYGRFSNGKLSSSASLGIMNEQNRFSYLKNDEKLRIENNAINNYQGKINLAYKFNSRHSIVLNSWFLMAKRLIPPSLYEQNSDASQLDNSSRINGAYKFMDKSLSVKLNVAFMDDLLNYEAPGKNLHTESRSISFIESIKLDWALLPNHLLRMQLLNKQMKVTSNAYYKNERIDELNLIIQYNLQIALKHTLQGGIRAGTRFENNHRIAPFIYYNYKLTKQLGFLMAAGKKFRYPGFNDLFWHQGGNRELVPENAFETEFGINWQASHWFSFTTRNYYKEVENWIQWIPESGVFSAQNIDKVVGYGSENSISFSRRSNRYDMDANMVYQFSRMKDGHKKTGAKQLIYTPVHLLKTNFSVNTNSWRLVCEVNFTGKVYTNQDNSSFLPHYSLMNMNIEKKWKLNRLEIYNWIRINNIFDKRYFSIQNYVMPGRTFELGVKLQPEVFDQ